MNIGLTAPPWHGPAKPAQGADILKNLKKPKVLGLGKGGEGLFSARAGEEMQSGCHRSAHQAVRYPLMLEALHAGIPAAPPHSHLKHSLHRARSDHWLTQTMWNVKSQHVPWTVD